MLNLSVIDPPRGLQAKRFGAYYTDQRIADFLLHWGVRCASDTVIDPSFGGGVFLESALKRLEKLGGDYTRQVYGVEIDKEVHGQVAYELSLLYNLNPKNLIYSDFFEVDKKKVRPVDAVVGNPPFIRYQRFSGVDRQLALRRAERQGVSLSRLVSSWAPFLIHSCALLKQGGRLAMVIPSEIGHAAYARPVLKYLVDNFASTTLLTFRERLFPELSQDTLLLLAEDRRAKPGKLYIHDFIDAADLENTQEVIGKLSSAKEINPNDIISGRTTLASYWVSEEARTLYLKLLSSNKTKRLGELAEVGIGYVTGANSFFHLSKEEAKAESISASYLTRAVYRGRALSGLCFSKQDWKAAEQLGEAGFLLHLPPDKRLSKPVKAYIAKGERQGIHKAYKCRVRSPWYRVPHVYRPDAFLTYMSGLRPLLATNDADAVTPNSLHAVRLHADFSVSAQDLALRWQTSLTSLSVELEGHALGGGMLKLEPSEAKSVLLAYPSDTLTLAVVTDVFDQVNRFIRSGDEAAARDLLDELYLGRLLGLSESDIHTLREAAKLLRDRRYYKGRKRTSSAACSRSSLEPAESYAQRRGRPASGESL